MNNFEVIKKETLKINECTKKIPELYLKQADCSNNGFLPALDKIQKAALSIVENTGGTNDILEFINNLAEQTSILGLNASIEAARVGEMGKAFAVVAQEIQKLATNSNSSTLNINNLILDMRNKSEEIVLLTKEEMEIYMKGDTEFRSLQSPIEQIAKAGLELEGQKEQVECGQIDETTYKENIASLIKTIEGLRNEYMEIIRKLYEKDENKLNPVRERIKGLIGDVIGAAKEIGTIINFIKSMSEQTNLLGITASIEAARVGEYGKGFHLVALKIRELSDLTDGSIKRIEDILSSISSNIILIEHQKEVESSQFEAILTHSAEVDRLYGEIGMICSTVK